VDKYRSIKDEKTAVFKEKGSKFLGFAFPVSSIDEVKDLLEKCKKKYFDATHHCYAYRIGQTGQCFRANDDGEPNHSAGTPILNQLKAYNLSDVLVIVVRYYGGTKLGVSGLVKAYKQAAADCLDGAEVIEKIATEQLFFQSNYLAVNDLMAVIKRLGLAIVSQEYTESQVTFLATIPKSKIEEAVEILTDHGAENLKIQ